MRYLFTLIITCCLLVVPLGWSLGNAQTPTHEELTKPLQTYVVPKMAVGTEPIYSYVIGILKLAMDNTVHEYGPANIIPFELVAPQSRQLMQLEEGSVDISWAVTSKEREEHLLPVYFPIAGGLFGYRVAIIPQSMQNTFSSFSDVEPMKQLLAVQGYDWPDTQILKSNGFTVDTIDYPSSFKVVYSGMADYFPRSVLEIEHELFYYRNTSLAIENNHALFYPAPFFFFTSRNNPILAKRIELGLQRALASGQLAEFFRSQDIVKEAHDLMQGRTVHHLKNPTLSQKANDSIAIALEYNPIK